MWPWLPGIIGWVCGLAIGLFQGRKMMKDLIAIINRRTCYYPNHTCLRLHEQATEIADTTKRAQE